MSYYDYQPPNKFGYKDTLPEGDAEKIIKGSEFDDEFNKISAESQAIDQIVQENDGRLDEEIQNRVEGDQNLQNQIDSLIDGSINIGPDQVEGLPEYLDENYVSKATEEDQQIVSKFTFSSNAESNEILGDDIPSKFVVDSSAKEARFIAGSQAGVGDSYYPWDVELQGSLQLTNMAFPPSYMTYSAFGISAASEVYIRFRPADDPDNPLNDDPQPAKWIVKPNLDVDGKLWVDGADITQEITDLNASVGAVSGQIVFGGTYDPSTGLIVKPNLAGFVEGEPLPEYSTVQGKFLICIDSGSNPVELKEGDWLVAGESGWVPINYVSPEVLPSGAATNTLAYDGDKWVANNNLSVNLDTSKVTVNGPLSAELLQSLIWVGEGPVNSGLKLGNDIVVPVDQNGDGKPDEIDLGSNFVKFRNAYFSGTVKTGSIDASEDSVFGGTVRVNSDISGYYTELKNGQGIEQRAPAGTADGSAYRIFYGGNPSLQISNSGDYTAPSADVNIFTLTANKEIISIGAVHANEFKKSGGTASQLLCADGSVVDKGSVGGSGPDLSVYYTKTESDARFKPIGYKAPVDSVNGKTGAVSLTAADVGAKSSSYKAPVDSVNGKTGAVTLNAADVGASTFSGNYNDLTNKPTLYDGSDAVKTSGDQFVSGKKTVDSNDFGGVYFRKGSTGNRAGYFSMVCGYGGESDSFAVFKDINGNPSSIGQTYNMGLKDIYMDGYCNTRNTGGFNACQGSEYVGKYLFQDRKHGLYFEAKSNIQQTFILPCRMGNKDTNKLVWLGDMDCRYGAVYGNTSNMRTVETESLKLRDSFVLTIDDVMDAFSTLRNATKDETSVEGLRTAISDSIGGLLQKFESMKADLAAEFEDKVSKVVPEGTVEEPEFIEESETIQ